MTEFFSSRTLIINNKLSRAERDCPLRPPRLGFLAMRRRRTCNPKYRISLVATLHVIVRVCCL
jgi:hypothetical protein